MQLTHRQFIPVLAACLLVAPAAAQGPLAWKVVRSGGYVMAQVGALGMTCEGNVPMLAVGLPSGPASGQTSLTVATPGGSASVALRRNGTTNVWGGLVRDRRVLDLLASGEGSASVTAAGRGMRVPLAGGREALGTALAGCYSMPGVAVAKTAVPMPVSTKAPSSRPASAGTQLTGGIYVPTGFKCSELSWKANFVATGSGEGEDDVLVPEVIEDNQRFSRQHYPNRRITSASTFVDGKTKFALCPYDQVPASARVWPESRAKPVRGLPIEPGLYRTYDAFDGKPTPITGDGRCGVTGYVRFGPNSFEWIAVSNILDRNGYPTKKTENVRQSRRLRITRQIGEQVYDSPFRDGVEGTGEVWLVEAPDNFSTSQQECGITQFRPVDARIVPPALLPR